jgi:predicted dehydrogenase
MVAAAEAAGVANMVGFNYIRTPATHYARQLIAEGVIGEVTWFRGEHTEDFSPTRDARQLAHDGRLQRHAWAIWPRT